ncbi:MAG: histidine phosphatase family protein [Pseudomonadota bacterium]|nr:histidine phosphatase family protein [Pseudomonadota bacterium]
MRISLLRHGIAEDNAATDFDRELTPEGWLQLERVLDTLVGGGWSPGTILHSPLIRTTQTAASVHARFPHIPCIALDALALGSIDPILMAASRHPNPLLVGHEPTMGNLCGRLLGAPTGAIRFERAGFAYLEVDRLPTTRPARLLAFLPPEWTEGRG